MQYLIMKVIMHVSMYDDDELIHGYNYSYKYQVLIAANKAVMIS